MYSVGKKYDVEVVIAGESNIYDPIDSDLLWEWDLDDHVKKPDIYGLLDYDYYRNWDLDKDEPVVHEIPDDYEWEYEEVELEEEF